MLNSDKHTLLLPVLAFVLAFSLVLDACSTQPLNEPPVAAITPSEVLDTPTIEPTETLAAPITSTPLPSETPTVAPTFEATSIFTETPSATHTDAATLNGSTPTSSPSTINLDACDQTIWHPGTYKLVSDVKMTKYDCFYIHSHNVVFDCDHHTIQGTSYTGYGFFIRKFGLLQETPTNVEIRNCKISRLHTGIFASAGRNIYVHDNDLSNNKDDIDPKTRGGIFLGMTEGGGVRFNSVNGGRIERNTTSNQAIGIDVRDSDHIVVRSNTSVGNSAWGINLLNTSDSQVLGNIVKDNLRWCAWGTGVVGPGCDAGGIVLQSGSSRNVVRDNEVTGSNGNGIFIKAHGTPCGNDNLIENNKIFDAVYNAIEFSFCSGNRVIGNEIAKSLDAVFFGFTTNTEVRGNSITEMGNHGIISYNSRNSTIADNKIVNSRDGIYFYWDTWDPKNFAFLSPSPDKYASRDNLITNNLLQGNSVAGIHLLNSQHNRLLYNTFVKNGKDIWREGNTDGTTITNGK